MKVAVTYEDGKVFQHFGHTEYFKIYDVKDGKVVGSEIIPTDGSGHGALAGFLAAHKADALICGGIGGGALNALSEAGIRVLAGVSGDADSRVEEFVEGKLVFGTEANCSHSHEHGEGGSCKEHGCGHGSCGK